MAAAVYADPRLRHRVGLNYAAAAGRTRAERRGGPAAPRLLAPGSFLARQVQNFLALLESCRHQRYRPESLAVDGLRAGSTSTSPPDGAPGSCTATRI